MENLKEFIIKFNYPIKEKYLDLFVTFFKKKWIQLSRGLLDILGINSYEKYTTNMVMGVDYEDVIVGFESPTLKIDRFINPHSFKKFLLNIETPDSKNFYVEYCKFEEIVIDFVEYQNGVIKNTNDELVKCLEELKIKDEEIFEKNNIITRQLNTKESFIYIATTDIYASKNFYKIGSTSNLTKRLCSYNVGRPKSDSYYYIWSKKCLNSLHLEKYILNFLTKWKDSKNTEMINIPFEKLLQIVEYLCQSHEMGIKIVTAL